MILSELEIRKSKLNKEESQYLNLLEEIVTTGTKKSDRTGTGTISIFGSKLRFSLENDKVPMLTTKKMFTKGVIEELLFFLRGQTDSKILEAKGVNIWKGNTSREYLDKKGLTSYEEGEIGPMYGAQWRNFNSPLYDNLNKGVDQIQNVFNLIKNDPNSRRMIVTAYNPLVSHLTVLEPCHMFFQFYVDDGKLSAQWYQRSVDSFLGLPFNILSYAILTKIMAKAAGLEPKELIFVGGDTHVYLNHLDQVTEQISRVPFEFPTMKINKELSTIKDIEELELSDFVIKGYQSHTAIKAPMAV